MIPLFKTSFSIGKSILRIEDVVDIAQQHNLKKVVLVEDNFYGFRTAQKAFSSNSIPMVFGIRISVIQSSLDEKSSKLIFFAKNNKGINNAKQLYTKSQLSHDGVLNLSSLDKEDFIDLKIGVPFYDSYIYNNLFHFGASEIKLNNFDHFYMEEENSHPFDFQIQNALKNLNINTEKTKTIYYRDKQDIEAFQMYKAICSRKGRIPTYSCPNLEHFCSNEFCFESFLEKNAAL